jgi:hypothetical protein
MNSNKAVSTLHQRDATVSKNQNEKPYGPKTRAAVIKISQSGGTPVPKILEVPVSCQKPVSTRGCSTQSGFDQGHEVGELAKHLFLGGVEVARDVFAADQMISTRQFP